MMSGIVILIGIIAVLVLLVIWVIAIYNSMVRLRNIVDKEWRNVDVQLQRRYDLIPNLVETVKGYTKHESETLTKITEYRSQAMSAQNMAQRAEANNQLTGALAGLRVQLEAYPDLKANQNFLSLQEELSSTENKISFSRQLYNQVVTDYNTKIQVFPNNFFAVPFGFKEKELFELENQEAQKAPSIKF